MDSNIASGLIGVSGTLAGGVLAIVYTHFQTKKSDREKNKILLATIKRELDYSIEVLINETEELQSNFHTMHSKLYSQADTTAIKTLTDSVNTVTQKNSEHLILMAKIRMCFSEYESHFLKDETWREHYNAIHKILVERKQLFNALDVFDLVNSRKLNSLNQVFHSMTEQCKTLRVESGELSDVIYRMQQVYKDKRRINLLEELAQGAISNALMDQVLKFPLR